MLKIAVIGAGWVAGARHVPALLQSRRCKVIGVIDRHHERAERLAARCKLPHVGDDLNAAWLDDADAVTVALPPGAHYEVASALLAKGKHVLLEKPMCLSVAEGEALAEYARRAGRVLAIVHNFQFARSVARARAKLNAGHWGKIIGLHGFQLSSHQRRLPEWYESLPLGLFYDESPHLLYLLRAFAGELELRSANITPSATGRTTPAILQAEFSTASVPATLYLNFESPVSEWHFMIMTERGLAVIDIFRDILHFVPADGRHTARDIARSSWSMLSDHVLGFVSAGIRMLGGKLLYGNEEVVKRFLDAIEHRAELRDIDPQSALAVLRLQHAIIKQAT